MTYRDQACVANGCDFDKPCPSFRCKQIEIALREVAAETLEESAKEVECLFNGEVTRCNKSGVCAGCLSAARLRGRAAAARGGA